jgi:predicted nucleic acid-binding Zn ribbon protein
MPIREFKCINEQCGKVFEKRYLTNTLADCDQGKVRCSDCNYPGTRIVSRTARPKFEGSGFYETDYGRKN